MSKREMIERLRRARHELEPMVKDYYELNVILNELTKLEAEMRGEYEGSKNTRAVVQK